MNKNTLKAVVSAGIITVAAPTMPAQAEPVSTVVLATKALVTAAAGTLGTNAVKDCRVVYRHTDIKVFGRKIGSTHLPQLHCNRK